MDWLTDQLKTLLEGLVKGLADGIEYLTSEVIKTVTDLVLDAVRGIFGLWDTDALHSWWSWWDIDHNEYFSEYNDYFTDYYGVEIPAIYEPEAVSSG